MGDLLGDEHSVDQRLGDLRDAFLAIGDLLVDKKDMHLVDPERFEALIRVLTCELERTRLQAADELAFLRLERGEADKAAA